MYPQARFLGFITLLLLLIPSAVWLWRNNDLPDFSTFQDDSTYLVSAKSLATGSGYRIESLPGQPAQTKYPPLYPLLLSLAWRIDPQFPHNLPLAAWLSWLAIPAMLLAFAATLPYLGIEKGRALLVMALFALNYYVIWIGSHLLSEPLFLAMALVALLMLERAINPKRSANWAVAAGVGAGLAYLTRTAGIALLPAALLYIWNRGAYRARLSTAARFAAGMLPFVAGWMIWGQAHKLITTDPLFISYTGYGYQFADMLDNLHVVLWKNLDGLVWGLGSLIVPKFAPSLALKILAEVVAVAMISGVIRMLRKGYGRLYAIFAAVYGAMLILWGADERLALPIFPLGLAGLLYECEHLLRMLRSGVRAPQTGERAAAWAIMGVLCLLAAGVVAAQIYVSAVIQPENAVEHRLDKIQYLAAGDWLKTNAPRDAVILANTDPALNLYIGNPVICHTLPPRLWYAEDHAGLVAVWGHFGGLAQQHGWKYIYWLNGDRYLPLPPEDLEAIEVAQRADPLLEQAYRNDRVTIYRVMD